MGKMVVGYLPVSCEESYLRKSQLSIERVAHSVIVNQSVRPHIHSRAIRNNDKNRLNVFERRCHRVRCCHQTKHGQMRNQIQTASNSRFHHKAIMATPHNSSNSVAQCTQDLAGQIQDAVNLHFDNLGMLPNSSCHRMVANRCLCVVDHHRISNGLMLSHKFSNRDHQCSNSHGHKAKVSSGSELITIRPISFV